MGHGGCGLIKKVPSYYFRSYIPEVASKLNSNKNGFLADWLISSCSTINVFMPLGQALPLLCYAHNSKLFSCYQMLSLWVIIVTDSSIFIDDLLVEGVLG